MNIFRENHLNQSIRINELQYDDLTKKADPQKDQISFVFYRLIVQPDKREGTLRRSADVPPFLEWTSQEAMHLDCKIINWIMSIFGCFINITLKNYLKSNQWRF